MLDRVEARIGALEAAKMRAASRTKRRIALQEEERELDKMQKAIELGQDAVVVNADARTEAVAEADVAAPKKSTKK